MRKFIGKFLAAVLCVAMALSSVTVKADSVDQKYLALGADLTASQKKKVLELLDLDRSRRASCCAAPRRCWSRRGSA